MKDFKKLRIVLEGQLLGRKFFNAVKAMNFASQYHTGKRKDGSPEFQHQVEIALFCLSLPISNEEMLERILIRSFLHDTMEDYPVTIEHVTALFGAEIANGVFNLSKVYKGTKKEIKTFFLNLSNDLESAITKGVDRIHNHSTMLGTFKYEKVVEYRQETHNDILPMLKRARRKFPEYTSCFMLIETVLHRDLFMIDQWLIAADPTKPENQNDRCPADKLHVKELQ